MHLAEMNLNPQSRLRFPSDIKTIYPLRPPSCNWTKQSNQSKWGQLVKTSQIIVYFRFDCVRLSPQRKCTCNSYSSSLSPWWKQEQQWHRENMPFRIYSHANCTVKWRQQAGEQEMLFQCCCCDKVQDQDTTTSPVLDFLVKRQYNNNVYQYF